MLQLLISLVFVSLKIKLVFLHTSFLICLKTGVNFQILRAFQKLFADVLFLDFKVWPVFNVFLQLETDCFISAQSRGVEILKNMDHLLFGQFEERRRLLLSFSAFESV